MLSGETSQTEIRGWICRDDSLKCPTRSNIPLVPVWAGGQHHADGGALRTRIDVHPAVMIEDGPFHDRQTQSHSAGFGRAKRREHFLP